MTVAAPTRTFGTLRHAAGVWVIDAEPNVMRWVRRMLPRVSSAKGGGCWVKDTPEIARDIEWFLGRWPLELDDDTAEYLEAQAERQREIEASVFRILQGHEVVELAGELPFPPQPHQAQAAAIALNTGRLLLGDDLGLGKTYSALLTLTDPQRLPALIVTPTHLTRQWRREIAKFMPHLAAHEIRRTDVYDPSTHREMAGRTPDVLICTYTKLHGWANHLAGEVKTCVFEEVHELRRTESRKYQSATIVARGASLNMGLTATPVYNYGGEAHSIISVLDPDVLGNRHEFLREWGAGDGYGSNDPKTKVENPAGLGRYLREVGVFVRRTDADLGRDKLPAERIPHLIDADDQTMRDGIASARDVARRIMAKATAPLERGKAAREIDWRLRQITGIAKAPYVAAFAKLLLETEERVIVWAWHRSVWDEIADALASYNPALYTGTESPAAKDRAIQAFTCPIDDPDASRVLLMSLRSGAGVDGLQTTCRTGVFGELDWSPAMHDQCIGRLDRPGQTRRVRAYFLHTDSGSDPAIMDVLNDKRMQGEPIRDPDRDVFSTAGGGNEDRARMLAQAVLEQGGGGRS
ncbi:MAG: DEAD/DEAH box helicase [Patulibacter sp.]|nr:DEAD/DEAH box helicase [Patulibacter sp.]